MPTKNFRLAIGVFIIGLPAYLIRFRLGPLPSTLLELNFGILFLVWLIKYARQDYTYLKIQIKNHKYFFNIFLIFFISSIVSIFVSDMWYYSLGQWRAYFLEPMLVFVMLIGHTISANHPYPSLERRGCALSPPARPARSTRSSEAGGGGVGLKAGGGGSNQLSTTDLIWFLALSTLSISLFGIAQRFTGWHIGNVDWIALETGRITSFFLSPNAVGLFLGPIIPLIAYLLIKNRSHNPRRNFIIYHLSFIICALALVTLLLTKSLGAILAVALGILLFAYLVGYKKTALITVLIVGCLVLSTYRLGLLQNKSQSLANRLTLWTYSWHYLTESPKNFVFGTGIRQFFRKIQKPYYDVHKMERLIYPHNIFLNFWTETGLFGMLSFTTLYCYLLRATWYVYIKSDKILGASLLAALIIILVHGLIDVPYFKNDLAMLFWILTALVVTNENTIRTNES